MDPTVCGFTAAAKTHGAWLRCVLRGVRFRDIDRKR